jgi:hypothetical protein
MMSRTMKMGAPLALAAMLGCGGGYEDGTLSVTIYGEEYAEVGIPADETDGWAITFDRFLVVVGEIELAVGHDHGDHGRFEDATYRVFDLAEPSGGAGHPVLSAAVAGGHYDHAGYRIGPSADATTGNASAGDTAWMVAEMLAVHVAGSATDGAVTKTFAWDFSRGVYYAHCHVDALVDGGEGAAELTIHADHLFFDDLVDEDPAVAFGLIAEADADGNGEVTQEELAAFDLSTQARYQVGSLPIENLWDFIAYQVTLIGHVDGEGHCDSILRDP